MKKSHMKKIAKQIAELEKRIQNTEDQEEVYILMGKMEKLLVGVEELDDLDALDDQIQKFLNKS